MDSGNLIVTLLVVLSLAFMGVSGLLAGIYLGKSKS